MADRRNFEVFTAKGKPYETLPGLLEQADALFPQDKRHGGVVVFGLNRFKDIWTFDVTTSWTAWHVDGHPFRFSGETPKDAVRAFLDYVREKGVDVAALMET